jgi:hypothetical protein
VKRALVLGGAACVWDDAKAAKELCEYDLTIAVNDIGTVWPEHLDIWATLHPEKFKKWQDSRAARKLNTDYRAITWVSGAKRDARIDAKTADWGGSSGLFAVKIALEANCTHIVLAGVPMTSTPHYHSPVKKWKYADTHRPRWERHLPKFKDKARSMSGWTRQLLGPATKEWINGGV